MKKLIQTLEKIQLAAGAIFLALFFAVILIQITTRQLGISVIWTEEVANYSFIWAVFMGASVMVNRKEHFTFDLLQRKLKGKLRIMLSLIIDTMLILFNITIFYFGILTVQRFWNYNWVSLPEMKMGYVWIAVPIMAGTMVVYLISHVIQHVKSLREVSG
ncbi:TRAP transporter small permease [Gracilibacillus sp. YIM 98692]|uniref:TRAP transporter small permease n=1 Tax=Gracilibacillus sp. YIM 98692 TaxID=2663532 RepID=UPI0013D144DC|nr:TRAP transporter small permease [Gracilibacillus sp. YIM 98692]